MPGKKPFLKRISSFSKAAALGMRRSGKSRSKAKALFIQAIKASCKTACAIWGATSEQPQVYLCFSVLNGAAGSPS